MYRTRAERSVRFFKARIIKFNRKLDRIGEKAVKDPTHSKLMIEGQALLTFASMTMMVNPGILRTLNTKRRMKK